MANLRELGGEAEGRAVAFLQELGYTIVTRNAHSRRGEIDIVALDGDLLVFIEVKLRRVGSPEEAITPVKAGRIRAAARDYLIAMGEPDRAYRYDLIAIDGDGIRHHRHALQQD